MARIVPGHNRIAVAVYAQWAAMGLMACLAIGVLLATVAAAVGLLPFLTLPLRFGDTVVPQAGMVLQVGIALLLVCIAAVLPSGLRVLRLERSHRDFAMCMSDVADAYHAAHAADRAGAFRLGAEFDAVKERIMYLRQHPDLGSIEPEILEIAAQMSFTSRDLAQTYSDENVSRARGFLSHREEEIALFESRIGKAVAVSRELRDRTAAVETAERDNDTRLKALEDEFGDLLHDLGFARPKKDAKIIPLAQATAAE